MFEIDQIVHGFRLISKEQVEETQSLCMVFEHQKTKAPVLVMSTDDDNKVFCTYFRTPPTDETGVAHILEHSVLNGSAKYPVKEPFVELIKASLYTFLNAMTYDDKTVYPVSSRNAQDYRNLMDIYLDAVFNPILSEQTFMQEGWHHEIEDVDGDLEFSGVVYNEMLGATSSPESILYDEVERLLMPDSTYGFNAGGEPANIPDLTYQEFVDFHKRHYHPSNSKTVLYGDFDVAEKLEHLAEYFDSYDYQEPDSKIICQPRKTEPMTKEIGYPATPGAAGPGQVFVLRAWLLEDPTDPEYNLAMNILAHILTGTPASPLRRALIESQLGEQSIHWLSNEAYETYYACGLKGTDKEKVPEVEKLIDDTLRSLADDGIEPRAVEAAINSTEFRLREANYGGYSKGLIYALGSAASWLYDADPLVLLKYESPLAAIKENVAAGPYFENMIRKYFLENSHRLTLTMVPDEEYETKRVEKLNRRLADTKAGLAENELAELADQCAKLREAQLTPDKPEALATLPKLPLNCIDRQAEAIPFEIVDETQHLSLAEQPTNRIAYLKLAFDASGVPTELLPYVPLFTQVIQQVATSKRTYVDLTQEIGIQTGGISISYSAKSRYHQPDQIRSFIACNGKALLHKVPDLVQLMTEILTDADLTAESRILETCRMARSSIESEIKNSGSRFAMARMDAVHSQEGKYAELTGGIEQFYFLEKLLAEMEVDTKAVIAQFERLRDIVIRRGGLLVHVTGGRDELAAVQKELPNLLDKLPEGCAEPTEHSFPKFPINEGIIIPSKVQYVCKGINFAANGRSYDGTSPVLTKLLSTDYLWNTVRVQGNAYGCMCNFSLFSGIFQCCSYRDPNLAETIEAFDQMANYLEELELPREEFVKIIIGTMGQVDSPRTESQKGALAFSRHVYGISQEIVQRQREQILDCCLEDLKAYVPSFRKLASEGTVCVVGSQEKIEENRDCFDSLTAIFAR